MARARLTRSELKAQDEITTTLERWTESAMARKSEVITGAIIVVVLAAAFFGWRYYSSSRNAAAHKELSNVIFAFQDPAVEERERTLRERPSLPHKRQWRTTLPRRRHPSLSTIWR